MKSRLLQFAAGVALATFGLTPAEAQSEPPVAYDNVVIILDASGSMKAPMPGTRTDKMTAAKNALKQVVRQIPASTRIGLLVFSASGIKDHWVYPLGPRDDAALTKAIDSPVPQADTPLGRYLKIGADRLLQERTKQLGYGSYRLLVVTDGEAQDQALVDRYTPEIIARGITVDVIGVAMDSRHTLATKAHSYRAANDAAALKQALAEVFAEVGSSGKDQLDAEAFALLAPIPDALAAAMLQALAPAGNQPIGERPRPQPTPAPGSAPSKPTVAPAPSVQSPGPAPAPAPAPAPPPARPRSPSFGFIGLIIALVVVSSVIRLARRR